MKVLWTKEKIDNFLAGKTSVNPVSKKVSGPSGSSKKVKMMSKAN